MAKDEISDNRGSTRTEARKNAISVEERKLLLEERKAAFDFELRKQELQIKERESGWASRFFSPLTTTILAGILTLAGSVVATLMQGQQTLLLEQRKFDFTKQIETQKEQHELIAKMVAVGDEKQARANIRFLAEVGLIRDPELAMRLLQAPTVAVLPPANAPAQVPARGLYQQPVLVVDPGIHTGVIRSSSVDANGRFGITGSEDKTVRIWSLTDGKLLQTIRMPAGPSNVGKIFATAINPSGDVIAAGGWTADLSATESIYLFDRSGKMIKRIDGLTDVATKLVFSSNGRYLAAATGGESVLHIYERDKQWTEVFKDINYRDAIYGIDFAADGRLATSSYDGKVRLYGGPDFKLVVSAATSGGHSPHGIAFSPNGNVLAVGHADTATVELLDGHTLRSMRSPDIGGVTGVVPHVLWSKDGQTLFGGGRTSVLAWAKAGNGERRILPGVFSDTITGLDALPDGGILIATADPVLKCFNADGTTRWSVQAPIVGLRDEASTLAVSANGMIVEFGSLRFDVNSPQLIRNPPADNLTARPNLDGLSIANWKNGFSPTLDGKPIELDRYEKSRSLAIHPDNDRFVLGTEWHLQAISKNHQLVWRRDSPAPVLGVNITGDGRLVVAAYEDGSIRWYRMDDGRELLAFMVMTDKMNWVAWTPEGFYAATVGAQSVLQWYVSRGPDAAGVSTRVSDIPSLRRPDVLALVLRELSIERAIGPVALAAVRAAVQTATGTPTDPQSK